MNTAKENIIKTIKSHNMLSGGEHIVVGLSGGPDSLCLFHVLWSLRDELNLTFSVVHVNHGFRGREADEDQKFVENLCRSLDIKCNSVVVNCDEIAGEKGISGEEAGRQVRYDSFRREAKVHLSKGISKEKIKIVVAQNRNDQAETILFRIIRGTGIDGLKAMKYAYLDESGFEIIRPLLDTDRSEIEEYISENNLEPRIDKTNYKPIYSRNKIRLNIIPYIDKEFGGDVSAALRRLGYLAEMDSEYLLKVSRQALNDVKTVNSDGALDRDELKKLDPAILSRVIKLGLSDAGLKENVSMVHIRAAMDLIKGKRVSGHADFPKNYGIDAAYDRVYINPPKQYKCKDVSLSEKHPDMDSRFDGVKNNISLQVKTMDINEFTPSNKVAAFDADLIDVSPKDMILRARRPGDYIRLKGGCKKIKKLFVDMKVPKHIRDDVKMVCVGNQVIWIPKGYTKDRYCETAKITESTKKVITLEISKVL